MSDYSPVYCSGITPFTMTASATITGGQVVSASGVGTVAPSGAAVTTAIGVAAHDAANGARVSIWPLSNVVHELVCTNGITAVGGVQTGTAGTVDPATTSIAAASAAGTLIGVAVSTATSGNKVRFLGRN